MFELFGFVLGLLFGSFLNVCISRLPAHESIVSPRSRCPQCDHSIRWYDNIPLVSWVLLRARCRDCKAQISWRYPAVELATAIWFAIGAFRLRTAIQSGGGGSAASMPMNSIRALLFLSFGFLLIGLMVMDWQTQRLPDAFTLSGMGIGFLLTCVQAFFLTPGEGDIILNPQHQLRLNSPGSFAAQGNVFMTGTEALIFGRIVAICSAALLLVVVRAIYKAIRGREGMGLGDVKLLAMIAAFAGFGQSLLALFFGVVTASAYGTILLARQRAGAATRLPFGSFLCAGGLFSAMFGPGIAAWYMNLLR